MFRHSWYQSKKFEMANRRDWGGGGDDPEESTQRMIERIWESLNDIQRRMDQQAPVPSVAVPPGDGETVPIAPVPPGVEVPFVAPFPPPPPVLLAEEPVMQVEKFLRLQPPTNSGGPNLDIAEHWVHDIEIVFATMRCPTVDKLVLAAYQLRGFTLEWWRLKMQTTFAVGCPRFFLSQAVSSGLCPGTCVVPLRSVSSDLDTLTPVFELCVRLRERRQWDSDYRTFLREFPTELVTREAHPYPHRSIIVLPNNGILPICINGYAENPWPEI
ncbi:hypothetical protein Taro_032139 [Colocasia esculenta]|uniref:Retrotransposon gag domain-containing protein n=1 Tax=Colocasia esculenta TaxID=4460 RepID=A0A843VU03_COLES|nr:hypothetical protein [Colocasia esculenta]